MAKSSKGKKNTGKKADSKSSRSISRSPAEPPAPPAPPIRREIAGGFFLFLGVFVVISFFNTDGKVIIFLSNFLKGLLGRGYYAVAPVCFLLAYTLIFHRGRPVTMRVISGLLVPILLAAIINLYIYIAPPTGGLQALVSDLFDMGRALKSGGVVGGLISSALIETIGGTGAAIVLIALFAFFLVKALPFRLSSVFGKLKDRAAVPYEPEPEEELPEDEPPARPVRAAAETDKRSSRPVRVNDPAIATSPMPKVRRFNMDLPIGDEGDALPLNKLEDIPDQSFGSGGAKRARVRRKASAAELRAEAPASDAPDASAVKLEGRDIGDGWIELDGGAKGASTVKPVPSVKPSASVPVAAVISDPPKIERIKREDVEIESEQFSHSIKAEADAAEEYVFPPIELLNEGDIGATDSKDEISLNRERLENAINSFGINASVVGVIRGPTVTRYDFELEQGVKLSKVTNLAGDLALALGVINVRIAPIPEKISTVGIEVPNKLVSTVYLRTILESQKFVGAKSKLSFAVGKDIGGECIVGNIAKLPHMLIAGTTGSGKSVCMNSLILSLLYKARPDEVKFIMIDPKMVELGIYSGIPHMLTPVVTEPKKAAGALQWAVVEMLKRYRLFSEAGVRDVESYNRHCQSTGEKTLPQVVVVIDELADLMMIAAKEVEESICRVAQMGRAAGMHLVVATQRPSADVITGLMKANIPSRIAFAVSSAMESRIIMDQSGAEKLIGMGDMLYSPLGAGKPTRVQGAFVSDEERERVISFIKENNPGAKPENNREIGEYMTRAEQSRDSSKEKESESASPAGEYDEMLPQAVEAILETGQCSVSMLQRRVKLGYSRAARIVDQMEELGIVGPYEGAKPRSVLVDRDGWRQLCMQLGFTPDGDAALAAEMSEDADI